MSTTLKIDVTSEVQQQSNQSAAPSGFLSDEFNKAKDDHLDRYRSERSSTTAQAKAYFERERIKEQEKIDRERAKEQLRADRERNRALAIGSRQQTRDEDWYDRDQARQRREKASAASRAEAMQKRDEDWYDRDLLRQRSEKQRAEALARRQSEQKQRAAAAQQKRDEDYHQRDQQRQWWNNPNNVASAMRGRQIFGAQVRGSMAAQRLGFSAGSSVTRLSAGFAGLTARLHPLIAVAGALVGAWSSARAHLLEEADRVRRVSAPLKAQEQINKMRNLQTDIEIAGRHGERMARNEDMQNRRDNAWRLISVGVSAAIDKALAPITDPIEEWYTGMLESLAGMSNHSKKQTEYLSALVGMSKEQLDEMGIKAGQRAALAQAVQNAEKVLKVLNGSTGNFTKEDDITNTLKTADWVGWRGQDAPNLDPSVWKKRQGK